MVLEVGDLVLKLLLNLLVKVEKKLKLNLL